MKQWFSVLIKFNLRFSFIPFTVFISILTQIHGSFFLHREIIITMIFF
nr:MAG TPA: hypothetical protein [Bacteriophage sp.]